MFLLKRPLKNSFKAKPSRSLRQRLQMLFAIMAVLPTVVLMIFAILFYYFVVDAWFSKRVDTALNESLAVAQAYINEHKNIIRTDALTMARDLNRQASSLSLNPSLLIQQLQGQALLRSLSGALLVDSLGNTIAYAGFTDVFENKKLPEIIQNTTDVQLFSDTDIVSALIPLDRFVDTYLFISRRVDPLAIRASQRATEATAEYKQAESNRKSLQYFLFLTLLLVTLTLVITALYVANRLSKSITRPIRQLVSASREVRSGNLEVVTPVYHRKDELRTLTVAFNRMTRQLYRQRRDLLAAHQQVQERREFIESVLAGISSGVVSLSGDGQINIHNNAAKKVIPGNNIKSFIPDIDAWLKTAEQKGTIQHQISHDQRKYLVRLSAYPYGYILTFENITQLLQAQKTAAWVDVAKRLAHEIKNPLTPIQLSAERLQRKFGKQIVEESALFESLIDTITRQVDDLKRLLNEFSAFARMPRANRTKMDLVKLCQELVVAYPETDFFSVETYVPFQGDAGLLRQALINLIKNAQEAASTHIILSLIRQDGLIKISLKDNGIGITNPQQAEELMEPYVTTKQKGTGLGLAIVKKIVDEHEGVLKMQPLTTTDDDPSTTTGTEIIIQFTEQNNKE